MPEPVKPADSTATDDFDYEAEFNAMVAKREGTEPAPAAAPEPEPAAAEPAPEGEPAPAAEPADAPASAEPAADPAPAAEPAPEDAELADLPPAVKAKIAARLEAAKAAEEKAKKLENDNRSMAGRMSAYQRRYEEAVGKRKPEPAPQPTAEQSAEWAQFVKDYPDIAKAIEAKFQTAQAAAPEGSVTQDVVQYVQEQKRRQFLEDSWAVIATVHPAWREDVKTKEFQEWKASSPTYEKLAASDDIADAVALFDLYSLVKSKQPATSKPADPKAAQLAARREAQAEGARAPASKSAAPNQSLDMADEDQLFAFYAKQADERSRRRSI